MAVKSVYVKDEDVELWDKAKDLAGESLSSLLTNYVKEFVLTKEAAIYGKEKIVLCYKDNGTIPVAKSFYGKWLIHPEEALQEFRDLDYIDKYAVAITQKNNIVVFYFIQGFTPQPSEDGKFSYGKITVFNSITDLKYTKSLPNFVIGEIIEKMGAVEIEELDI